MLDVVSRAWHNVFVVERDRNQGKQKRNTQHMSPFEEFLSNLVKAMPGATLSDVEKDSAYLHLEGCRFWVLADNWKNKYEVRLNLPHEQKNHLGGKYRNLAENTEYSGSYTQIARLVSRIEKDLPQIREMVANFTENKAKYDEKETIQNSNTAFIEKVLGNKKLGTIPCSAKASFTNQNIELTLHLTAEQLLELKKIMEVFFV